MENYIVINGKKAELTEEQLKALGINVNETDPFKRVPNNEWYYYIDGTGSIVDSYEYSNYFADHAYDVANYCTNRSLMEQRALHETLNRLLWRYSMQHEGDQIDWSNHRQKKFEFCYNYGNDAFHVTSHISIKTEGTIYFLTEKIAKAAIQEIVIPFMKKHPEFKW